MKKKFVIFIVLLLLTTGIYPQSNTQDNKLANAVANLDQAITFNDYQSLNEKFKTSIARDSSQWLPYYYAAYCEVRMGFLVKQDETKNNDYSLSAKSNIQKAEKNCHDNPAYMAEIYNVYSMAYRVLIAARPMVNGLKYGGIANEYLDKALKLSPQNPRSLYLAGQVKFLTPALFGGDKSKAKQLLLMALKNFNLQHDSPVLPHWGKNECEVLISKIK